MSKTENLVQYQDTKTTPPEVIYEDLKRYQLPPDLNQSCIEDTLRSVDYWFYAATPKPTTKNIISQLKIHYEEINEGDKALQKLLDALETDDLNEVFTTQNMQNPELSALWDELIDAFGDQIVTATGMLRFLGCDPKRVLANISASNLSKFENGLPVRKEEGGKILKGARYKKVDLTFATAAVRVQGMDITDVEFTCPLTMEQLLNEKGPE